MFSKILLYYFYRDKNTELQCFNDLRIIKLKKIKIKKITI